MSKIIKEPKNKTRTPVVIYAVAVIAIVLNIALGLFPSFVWISIA
jgi:NADH-quinone oxidoreductase subunit N